MYVYDAVDHLKNYRIVFCAIEKNIEKSGLYFKSDEIAEYDVVTKLYLSPMDSTNKDYIVIEMYGQNFPIISQSTIDSLPNGHEQAQWWYAKEFTPVITSAAEETGRSTVTGYGLLESYTYELYGQEVKHYLRFWEEYDVRDVTRNQISMASATIRVSEKWIDSSHENLCDPNSSALRLAEVSLAYKTKSNTAVMQAQATGNVDKNGQIVTDFDISVGVGLAGLSAPSFNIIWESGDINYDTGVFHGIYTNGIEGYGRASEMKLKDTLRLQHINNRLTVNWIYADYGGVASTGTASIVFKYRIDNVNDYTQSQIKEDIRSFTINVT